jgi:uncharacterized protein YraI
MRKTILVLIFFLLLAGCAPAVPATPTATPDSIHSLATPAYGAVMVLSGTGYKTVSLRDQPNPQAHQIGSVTPGDSGKLIGIDPSGLWLLVEIKKQTGWVAIQYLDYTIAQ